VEGSPKLGFAGEGGGGEPKTLLGVGCRSVVCPNQTFRRRRRNVPPQRGGEAILHKPRGTAPRSSFSKEKREKCLKRKKGGRALNLIDAIGGGRFG